MTGADVQAMADHVADLMGERLRIGGRGLEEKLRRGGRALPRRVRREAAFLAESARLAQVPKLHRQIDMKRAERARDICIGHLKPIGSSERRRVAALDFVTTLALVVFVVGAGLIVVLRLRGFI